jgi:glycosyltransferase involved in cell wall biosynthesis
MMVKESLSVIISVGPRHDGVRSLIEEYDEALRSCVADYEFILVIDGDYPDVVDELAALKVDCPKIRIIQLSRSFGDSVAISVGIERARGALVMTLPCFHQVEPHTLPRIIAGLEGYDMVEGRRWPRLDSRLNRFSTWLYHKIIRLVTGFTFRDIGCSARIMRRQVADEVMLYGEQSTFLPLLVANRGFAVREVSVPQSPKDPYRRIYSPGVYARRLLDIFTIFFLIRFTKAPLRFFGVVGSIFLAVGIAMIAFVTGERLFLETAAAGRPMLLFGVVFVVLGFQLFAIGLVGELIIFTHGRDLKEYSVAEVIDLKAPDAPEAGTGNRRA